MGATSAMPVKHDFTFTNEILGNDVQAASLMQLNDGTHHSRSFTGKQGVINKKNVLFKEKVEQYEKLHC